MPRVTSVLKNTRDFDLLKVLISEIGHEKSATTLSKYFQIGSLGDFVLDWDSPQTRDVVLRKKCKSGEEVSVSALLGSESHDRESGSNSFWEVLMKVCIKKPGLSSILQFDCCVTDRRFKGSDFDIRQAYYLPSTTSLDSSIYRGPSFSSLDPGLQDELKNYLISKGIDQELTTFLIGHIHRKEQGQYMNWLLKLQEMMKINDDQTKTI